MTTEPMADAPGPGAPGIDAPGINAPGTDGPAADELVVVPVRHPGRVVAAVVVLAVVGVFAYRLANVPNLQYDQITAHLTQHSILVGLWRTIEIAIVSQAVGIVLGVVLASMRLSRNPVFSAVSWVYIWFFRGTPRLVQVLFWYNGFLLVFQRLTLTIPVVHWKLFDVQSQDVITTFVAAVLALGLNEGAYMAEVTRAGILSVDAGQAEAAQALGMRPTLLFRRIVLPQAMRVIIPPTGNEFISMIKDTALVQTIGQYELLGRAEAISSQNAAVFELLVMSCIWYLVLTSVAQTGQFYLERRFARGNVGTLPPTPVQKLRALAARARA